METIILINGRGDQIKVNVDDYNIYEEDNITWSSKDQCTVLVYGRRSLEIEARRKREEKEREEKKLSNILKKGANKFCNWILEA